LGVIEVQPVTCREGHLVVATEIGGGHERIRPVLEHVSGEDRGHDLEDHEDRDHPDQRSAQVPMLCRRVVDFSAVTASPPAGDWPSLNGRGSDSAAAIELNHPMHALPQEVYSVGLIAERLCRSYNAG
jgi:hypothetical protein